MKYRYRSRLAQMCANFDSPMVEDSPEILLMRYVCEGRTEEACALFKDTKLFGGLSAVDAPYGRFEGSKGIREFAEGFLIRFEAVSASVEPICQTRACGRSVTEMNINFVVNGMINQIPVFVVGDLRECGMLDEMRFYTHFSHVPGQTPYRKPIFKTAHLEMGDPNLMTGSVKEYYEALHHVPKLDVEKIVSSMGDDCVFGGYDPRPAEIEYNGNVSQADDPSKEEPAPMSRKLLTQIYSGMSSYIPRWVGMRYETLIDNGITGVIEWQHIVTDHGVEEAGRVCMSAISAYTRGKDGRLCSIRICDYAGFERTIDWSKTPVSREEAYSINRVHEFPGH